MAANPIGIVIGLIAGLVAGLLYLWNTNEGFRETVIAVWNAIKETVGGVLTWFSELPGKFTTFMTNIGTAVSNGIGRRGRLVQAAARACLARRSALVTKLRTKGAEALKTLGDKVQDGIAEAVEFVRELPGKAVSALGNLSSTLSNAGRQLIDGFIGAIGAGFDRVKQELGRLTSLLPSWKGPPARDRKILANAGRLVIDGFSTRHGRPVRRRPGKIPGGTVR